MRTETIEEIQSAFYNLDMKISPVDFYNQCREIGFNPSVALHAIKEFSVRLQLTGEQVAFWNEFMIETERMIKTLTIRRKDDFEFLGKRPVWLVVQGVLEDDDPFNLIKLRLYATT